MFTVSCPCGQTVQIRPTKAGTTIQCQSCGGHFVVPSLGTMKRSVLHSEPIIGNPVGSANDPANEQRSEIPNSFYAHFSGQVGSTGRASSTTMENYSGVVISAIDAVLAASDLEHGFELMVSLALLPDATRLLQIETAPPTNSSTTSGDASDECANVLRLMTERIESIAIPNIQDGPVAFIVYRRFKLGVGTKIGIKPFSLYQQQIEKHGVDQALTWAANPTSLSPDKPSARFKWWRAISGRLRNAFFKPTAVEAPSPTEEQKYDEVVAWIDYTNDRFGKASDTELNQMLRRSPHEISLRVAIAERYARKDNYQQTIKAYSEAIALAPEWAPLLGRRGLQHLMAGNHQAALIDLNSAIELAPFASWYYFHRSKIFGELEAWNPTLADLDKAIDLAPREPVFLFRRAEIQIHLDQSARAVEDLGRILKLDPHNGASHAMLGWLHQQQDIRDEQRALEHLTVAIELMPGEIVPRIHRSMLYASQNKFELALNDCDSAIGIDQDLGQSHALRGRILQMQGEFEDAIESCNRAIELGIETAAVFLTRGFSYAATDQRELGLADCHSVLEIDPENPIALHLLGSLNLQQGELEAAMEALTEASRLAPDWVEPREQIALLHRMNENPQAAIEEQSALIQQQPEQPSHYVNRAFAHTQAGNHDDALRDYERACELDPENENIFFLRGCFYMDRQEDELALQDFNRTLELSGVYDGARLRRAAVLLRLKRHDKALEDYEKLIEKHPDDPYAYSGRAYVHQLRGDETAAEADIDRLAEISPEGAQEAAIQSLHAKVSRLESEERYDDAISVAEEIIEMAPDQPTGYRLRGWIRWYTEQHVEACEDYSHLLEITSDEPDLLSSRGQVYAEMGEWENALTDLDAAIVLSRSAGMNQLLAFALNGRSFTLAGLDRMDESARDFEESIKLCPTNSWAHYNRGIVLYQRGEHRQAKQFLQQALQLDGPPLTKRKRQRAEAVLDAMPEDQPDPDGF